MLLFIFNYKDNLAMLDIRDINTRRSDGVLFAIEVMDHYRARQDPLTRAMSSWNSLPVHVRNVNTKDQLKILLKNSIVNPYKKIE